MSRASRPKGGGPGRQQGSPGRRRPEREGGEWEKTRGEGEGENRRTEQTDRTDAPQSEGDTAPPSRRRRRRRRRHTGNISPPGPPRHALPRCHDARRRRHADPDTPHETHPRPPPVARGPGAPATSRRRKRPARGNARGGPQPPDGSGPGTPHPLPRPPTTRPRHDGDTSSPPASRERAEKEKADGARGERKPAGTELSRPATARVFSR